MDKNRVAPAVEPKEQPSDKKPENPEQKPEVKPEPKAGETIGEVLGNPAPKPKEVKMVPEAVFLDLKKELKELKRAIKEGANKTEVSADLKALADKHNIDEGFLRELVSTVQSENKAEFDKELEKRLKPFEEKDRSAKIDKAFESAFNRAIEQMPEYAKIVNKQVIKTLSLDPANASKTFNQLIEEAYGHLISGKKTLDPIGGNNRPINNGTLDMDRAKKDPEYFRQVMADPNLKKQYNEQLPERLSSVL